MGPCRQAWGGAATNYHPNSDNAAPKADPVYAEPPLHLGDVSVDRYNSRVDHDDFSQAGNLYRLFSDEQKDRLTTAIAGALGGAREEIQMRQLCHFFRADPDYGRRVAEKLNIEVPSEMLEAVQS